MIDSSSVVAWGFLRLHSLPSSTTAIIVFIIYLSMLKLKLMSIVCLFLSSSHFSLRQSFSLKGVENEQFYFEILLNIRNTFRVSPPLAFSTLPPRVFVSLLFSDGMKLITEDLINYFFRLWQLDYFKCWKYLLHTLFARVLGHLNCNNVVLLYVLKDCTLT